MGEIEKKTNDCDHSNKYISTQEFNKLMSENFVEGQHKQIWQTKTMFLISSKKIDCNEKIKNLNE